MRNNWIQIGVITSSLLAAAYSYACVEPLPPQPVQPAPPAAPASPPVVYTTKYVIYGKTNVVIDGYQFSNSSGTCLSIQNSNGVVVKNSKFLNCFGVGVEILNSSNVLVTTSKFEKLNGGVYAIQSKEVSVVKNTFKNVTRNGADYARGQFVQFNNVSGPGNSISFNNGLNELGNSYPEDAINMFNSSGTPDSPIMIDGNCITGGGPSNSGGGIMTGDYGGGYITVQNNTLVNPGQYGIGVAGGHDISFINNKVYGKQQSFTNVGAFVWNITPASGACYNIKFQDSEVNWTNKNGQATPFWSAGNCSNVSTPGNNWSAPVATLSCPAL